MTSLADTPAHLVMALPPGLRGHFLKYQPHASANFVGIDGAAVLYWASCWHVSYPEETAIYKGQRARIEHVLHEVGHALSLRIALPCYEIEERIGKRMYCLRLPAQRHNEALVLAAEIWLLAELGNDVPLVAYQDNADGQGLLPELEALRGGQLAAGLGRKLLRWLGDAGLLR